MNFFEQIDNRLSPQQMHIIFYVLLFIATALNFFAYFFENIAFDIPAVIKTRLIRTITFFILCPPFLIVSRESEVVGSFLCAY